MVRRVDRTRSGVFAALLAFLMWGVLPVFWKHLHFLPPVSIVAQRTLWSLVFLVPLVAFSSQRGQMAAGLKNPRAYAWHALSGLLLSSNWLLYVWATLDNHVIEVALGYYLNPFLNMLFGTLWFGERQNRWQLTAIGLALVGLALQIPAVSGFPWITVFIALTFALYAVVRKVAPLGSLSGLTLETMLLAPIALGWMIWKSPSLGEAFGSTPGNAALVISSGIATATPLFFFGYATRTLRLTTLGVLQFLAPTLQFLIGWLVYDEPMSATRLVSFSFVWLAIAVYAADAIGKRKRG